jgi:hypothetical protein
MRFDFLKERLDENPQGSAKKHRALPGKRYPAPSARKVKCIILMRFDFLKERLDENPQGSAKKHRAPPGKRYPAPSASMNVFCYPYRSVKLRYHL